MRILNSTTLHGWSAGSWYAIGMLGGLQERGHDIHMLVPEGRTAEAARGAGFTVYTDPDLREVSPLGARGVLKALRELRARVRPDLVVAHWGPDHTWWGLAAGDPRLRVPLVRLRAHDPRRPARHPLSRWLHRWRTEQFVVANERQRRAYTEGLRVPPDRVHRVPPGYAPGRPLPDGSASAAVRARCGAGPDDLLIGSIARFAPQKDHSTFFKAAALVAAARPEVRFLVAGYPAELDAEAIRTLAGRHPVLEGRWTLHDERLADGRPLVGAVDIGVVHSSGSEAICRVAFEYMEAGIPFVASRVGALPEVIREWSSGLLIPPGDPAALAGALVRLAGDRGLRERLGAGGRSRLEERFAPGPAVDRLERVLLEAARRGVA